MQCVQSDNNKRLLADTDSAKQISRERARSTSQSLPVQKACGQRVAAVKNVL